MRPHTLAMVSKSFVSAQHAKTHEQLVFTEPARRYHMCQKLCGVAFRLSSQHTSSQLAAC